MFSEFLRLLRNQAPDAVNLLPASFFRTSMVPPGTIHHLLVRIFLEAQDILGDGDSLVKNIPFTDDDFMALAHVLDAIVQLQRNGKLTEQAAGYLDKLPNTLLIISQYYQEKVSLSENEIARLEQERQSLQKEFDVALETNDGKMLLKFPPSGQITKSQKNSDKIFTVIR